MEEGEGNTGRAAAASASAARLASSSLCTGRYILPALWDAVSSVGVGGGGRGWGRKECRFHVCVEREGVDVCVCVECMWRWMCVCVYTAHTCHPLVDNVSAQLTAAPGLAERGGLISPLVSGLMVLPRTNVFELESVLEKEATNSSKTWAACSWSTWRGFGGWEAERRGKDEKGGGEGRGGDEGREGKGERRGEEKGENVKK